MKIRTVERIVKKEVGLPSSLTDFIVYCDSYDSTSYYLLSPMCVDDFQKIHGLL